MIDFLWRCEEEVGASSTLLGVSANPVSSGVPVLCVREGTSSEAERGLSLSLEVCSIWTTLGTPLSTILRWIAILAFELELEAVIFDIRLI